MGAGYPQSLNFNAQSKKHGFRIEKFGTYCRDFHENFVFDYFLVTVKKIKLSLKSEKNKGHFTGRPVYVMTIFFLE